MVEGPSVQGTTSGSVLSLEAGDRVRIVAPGASLDGAAGVVGVPVILESGEALVVDRAQVVGG
jgi:hypothetical protein